ncbi:retrovirus-related pol polyprotein from transposon TNT 1-94 [Tanacetum coccineum]|uniref:Retrovirus-related pol polyprotein from transposon TNT 1-94 n=1 Tax=Tanacetum coccineum TaxID=301880 RepID=A0ABQ4XKP8_9ASTR
MSRATSTKSWLWHRRLSHLNFGTINQLTSKDLVDGLPKFKYNKDHLCSACEQGKIKKASLPPKLVPSTESKLELLHMDLCGPMRVASINGKKYIFVIIDDYSRYTWVYFLRTKDEALDMIIDFINQVQRNLKLGIVHKTSIARTPQQNGVVERQNRTLVEVARTMLIFSKTRLLAISSPPASPLSPWSSSPPQIPIPLSPPSPVLPAPPPSPIRSLGYRAATIRMRAEAAATSHSLPLPPPFILSPTRPDAPPPMPTSAPTSFPPLLLPSDRPEVNLPPRMGLGLALGPGYEVGESSAAAAARPAGGHRADYGFVATMDRLVRRDPERYVGYGITDSWDEIVETLQGAPVSTDTELGAHMREFESLVRRDTDVIYTGLDVESGQTYSCAYTSAHGDRGWVLIYSNLVLDYLTFVSLFRNHYRVGSEEL